MPDFGHKRENSANPSETPTFADPCFTTVAHANMKIADVWHDSDDHFFRIRQSHAVEIMFFAEITNKITFERVQDALGGGLWIPLAPRAAQNTKRCAKPGSWLTPAPPFWEPKSKFWQFRDEAF